MYGDIGFAVVVSKDSEQINLWELDRDLIECSATKEENIRKQIKSLIDLFP